MWGKEGYLPKKESKTGDETEALPVPQDSIIVENVDQPITKKDQSQVITQSKEEKEKQLLASSLFVGLGSESTINLVSSQLYSTENLCPLWCTKKLALQKLLAITYTHGMNGFPSSRATSDIPFIFWKRKSNWLSLSQVFFLMQSVRARVSVQRWPRVNSPPWAERTGCNGKETWWKYCQ